MKPTWSARGFARVGRWLVEAHPREACLVGLGRGGRVVAWVRIANRDPRLGRFEMDVGDLIRVISRGKAAGLAPLVLGHSHPDAEPELSSRDRAAQIQGGVVRWPGTWTLVRSVSATSAGAWRLFPPAG